MKGGINQLQDQLTAWFMRRTASRGVRRVAPISAALASDIGVDRGENEDRVAVARGLDSEGHVFSLAALADGIGGMKQGSECAALTLGCFIGGFIEELRIGDDPREWLIHSSYRSNLAVQERFNGRGGSTLTAALISGSGQVTWLSVGDSRVYHAFDNRLIQLSVDDTIAGQLGKPREAGLDGSQLLQFIGIGSELEPHVDTLDPDSSGSVLLTSDGAHYLNQDVLSRILEHAPDTGVCAQRLTELATWCGGLDNASAVVIPLGTKVDEATAVKSALEVWDPFGDLQVITENERRIPTASPIHTPDEASSVPANTPAEPNRSVEDGQKAESKKNRRRGRSRTIKGGVPKEDPAGGNGDAVAEVPQLLIEFPEKTK